MNIDPDSEVETPSIISYNYGKAFFQKDEELNEEYFFKSVEMNQIQQSSINLLNEISKINHLNCTNFLQHQICENRLIVSAPKYYGGSLRDAINNANHNIGFSEFVYISVFLLLIDNIILVIEHSQWIKVFASQSFPAPQFKT